MSSSVDEEFYKDMLAEDNAELFIANSFHEALDSLMNYDEETNTYDPDSGMLFPPEIKDYNEYYDNKED